MKLIRRGEPTKLDTAPFGSECWIHLDGTEFEVYQQISRDEENPSWVFIGIKEQEC